MKIREKLRSFQQKWYEKKMLEKTPFALQTLYNQAMQKTEEDKVKREEAEE